MLQAIKNGSIVMVGRDASLTTMIVFDDERSAHLLYEGIKRFNAGLQACSFDGDIDALANVAFGEQKQSVLEIINPGAGLSAP